ncbi:uncharacterized protein LOC143902767 [Temnothorax americanus]|uniref:uncharacterized protein LOC143902767 n=1 Tax=Temnothorax americanus TaxID=1964332 RepID=UPI004068BCB1
MTVGFWNIAGLKGKNEGFWKVVEEWDIITFLETWVEEKEWSKVKKIMPERYVWKCQPATREKKRGRARGGIITGVRKGLEVEERIEREEEGIVERIVRTKEGEWKIISVYVNNDIDKKIRLIKEYTNEGGIGERIIIGGDFNARTGEKGGIMDIFGEERKSKDKEINAEGKKLIEFLEEEGLGILNGTKGDKEGEFTFTGGRGETVIDYIIGNQELWERTEEVRIGEQIDSDHQYVALEIAEKIEERKREEKKTKKVMNWSKEAVERYREKIEEKTIDGVNPEELMEEIKNAVTRAVSWKEIRIDNKAKRKNKWWDGQCVKLRREAKERLRKWKKGEGEKAEYIKKRKEYREMIKEKKEKEKERIIEEARKAKNEKEVWKFINRERKHRKEVNEEISEEQWNKHFKKLLGGVGAKQETAKEKQETGDSCENQEGIRREEVEEIIKKMKNRKAAGADGMPNEVWTNGGSRLKEAIWKICDMAWRKGEMIEDWNEGIIVPIVKKGEGKEAGDYRGVTLMNTSYKIYAAILAKRLEKEIEEKKLIPETQTGFRKGKGTIENIYTLNYVIGRAISKERGKLVATFIDLKAAFDSVDREILWKVMEKNGISKRLRDRIKELYKETKSVIRCNGEKGPCFWTVNGVRQGCPLSALLFILLLADLEEVMRKGQEGGVVIGNTKIWTLAYADDIVAVAEREEEMKQMIRRLEKYFDKRKLTVNVGKTKVMRFRKGGGRAKEIEWKWKGEQIEEVK